MQKLLAAIVDDDPARVEALLEANPHLATRAIAEARLYTASIRHWVYVADTALHLAAAGHRVEIVRLLLAAGCAGWCPESQVKTIRALLDAGAPVNAQDKNGATPLHRAVRTRCAAAVQCLLEAGADPLLPNLPGSTPFHLAVQDTGRGGSGTQAARAAQREIIRQFLRLGLSPALTDRPGKSLLDSARSVWIREALSPDSRA
jgi:ankyrin repeat protein